MEEACQILNVTKEADLSKITKVKKKLISFDVLYVSCKKIEL
jgi:hypothetical protein